MHLNLRSWLYLPAPRMSFDATSQWNVYLRGETCTYMYTVHVDWFARNQLASAVSDHQNDTCSMESNSVIKCTLVFVADHWIVFNFPLRWAAMTYYTVSGLSIMTYTMPRYSSGSFLIMAHWAILNANRVFVFNRAEIMVRLFVFLFWRIKYDFIFPRSLSECVLAFEKFSCDKLIYFCWTS